VDSQQSTTCSTGVPVPISRRTGSKGSADSRSGSIGFEGMAFPTPSAGEKDCVDSLQDCACSEGVLVSTSPAGAKGSVDSRHCPTCSAGMPTSQRTGSKDSVDSQQCSTESTGMPFFTSQTGSKDSVGSQQGCTASVHSSVSPPQNVAEVALPQLARVAAVDSIRLRPSLHGLDMGQGVGTPSGFPPAADHREAATMNRGPRKPSLPNTAFVRRNVRGASEQPRRLQKRTSL